MTRTPLIGERVQHAMLQYGRGLHGEVIAHLEDGRVMVRWDDAFVMTHDPINLRERLEGERPARRRR